MDNLRAKLIEETGTMIDEVPFIVDRRGCVPNTIEEESYRNDKIRKKGSVCSASVNCGTWQSTDSQTNKIGETFKQVDCSYNPRDLKRKRPKLCAALIHWWILKLEVEISARANVDF